MTYTATVVVTYSVLSNAKFYVKIKKHSDTKSFCILDLPGRTDYLLVYGLEKANLFLQHF